MKLSKVKWFELIISIILCELAGVIGSIFTISEIANWYTKLNKPFFSPPNWVFGPVWTTLYLLMGISVYLIWQQGIKKAAVKQALILFTIQLVLNVLWSLAFFGLHSPPLGFITILLLAYFILKTISAFKDISKIAAYLLYPYILWVSFASILNLALVLLN